MGIKKRKSSSGSYLCGMESKILEMLAGVVLPKEVLDYFEIANIESTATEIHIHLDEKMYASLKEDVHFESKGFIPEVSIADFPIRDHKVLLKVRRRRWRDLRTGKSFTLPLNITVEGTRYSREFASFLKETNGHLPSDLPNA
jgi:hypothetical protein